jgi:molybdopterin molybdotransferase
VLSRQLPSVQGRTDYIPVILSRDETPHQAIPLFGKSAMISILARADGYVVIPEHVEGLDSGTGVEVHLFSARQ